jgi:motility quorum-sensing regulator / GCU-specific mRNA interferase toxin
MEKRSAHYSLDSIKQMIIHQEMRIITASAFKDAFNLGLGEDEIIDTVLKLKPSHLYKSMTTNVDHTIWQDVYYIKNCEIDLYIKLQITEKSVVISFKERT